MADKKVSELSAITNLSGDDLLLVVNDPSGTPTSNKVTVSNLFANVVPNVVHKGTVTARANTTFTGTTMTVSSNATFSGTLTVTGSLVESGLTTHGGVQIYSGNTIFNDTMFANSGLVISSSVSSGGSNIIGKNGNLNANNAIASGTITDAMLATNIDKYMEKANTTLLVNDRLQVANAQVYLQVANATAELVSNTNFQSYVANTNSQIVNFVTNNYIQTVLSADFVSNTDFQTVVANTNAQINDRLQVANASLSLSSNSVTVSSNTGFRVTGKSEDVATSNAANEGISAGTIFYSNTYLYIATDENTIKRVLLSTF